MSDLAERPVLYSYWRSSASWRVRIAMNLKKIQFEYKAVNLLKGEQKSEEHTKLNPSSAIPVLVIDGNVLCQSISILEYLEETRSEGNHLLPKDPYQRSVVRNIVQMIASDTSPIQNLRVLNKVSNDFGEQHKLKWAKDVIEAGLKPVEQVLRTSSSSGQYCVGDQVSLADLCLVPQVYNAKRFNVDMEQFPKIKEINDNLMKIKEFIEAHPDNQPDAVSQ
ncbi:maleylacetoacetate isomerase GSTZ [Acrasis kona]|uniref:Maleylacetoacetate isomerase GSTZ n=1 Tax=Acrasis kona TaxID=1008807 RepID=A0AAW2ZK66_9EUKA